MTAAPVNAQACEERDHLPAGACRPTIAGTRGAGGEYPPLPEELFSSTGVVLPFGICPQRAKRRTVRWLRLRTLTLPRKAIDARLR